MQASLQGAPAPDQTESTFDYEALAGIGTLLLLIRAERLSRLFPGFVQAAPIQVQIAEPFCGILLHMSSYYSAVELAVVGGLWVVDLSKGWTGNRATREEGEHDEMACAEERA